MGLVGGLVPSPSALLLLLGAVALDRAWFGLVLVVCFGVGMATSLAVVGLSARDLLLRAEQRWGGRTWRGRELRALTSRVAALGVCAVGAGVVVRVLLGWS